MSCEKNVRTVWSRFLASMRGTWSDALDFCSVCLTSARNKSEISELKMHPTSNPIVFSQISSSSRYRLFFSGKVSMSCCEVEGPHSWQRTISTGSFCIEIAFPRLLSSMQSADIHSLLNCCWSGPHRTVRKNWTPFQTAHALPSSVERFDEVQQQFRVFSVFRWEFHLTFRIWSADIDSCAWDAR